MRKAEERWKLEWHTNECYTFCHPLYALFMCRNTNKITQSFQSISDIFKANHQTRVIGRKSICIERWCKERMERACVQGWVMVRCANTVQQWSIETTEDSSQVCSALTMRGRDYFVVAIWQFSAILHSEGMTSMAPNFGFNETTCSAH